MLASNWIHKNKENKKVKHVIHKAKLRHNDSCVAGIKNKMITPIKGVMEVNRRGLKRSKFMKYKIYLIYLWV